MDMNFGNKPIDNEQLSLIIKIAKAIKKEFIYVKGNMLFGCDELYNTLTVVTMNSPDDLFPVDFDFSVKYLNSYISECSRFGNQFYLGCNNNVKCLYNPVSNMYYYNEPSIGYYTTSIYVNTMNSLANCNKVYSNSDIKSNESFSTALASKAKNGAVLCRLTNDQANKYIMSMFSYIHPIAKSDKVTMNLYDDKNTFISECIIQKKAYTINEYIRYLHI